MCKPFEMCKPFGICKLVMCALILHYAHYDFVLIVDAARISPLKPQTLRIPSGKNHFYQKKKKSPMPK